MTTHTLSIADRLSDQEVLERVKRLARSERDATVELIVHLAVILERGLYLAEGCGSMFSYCTRVLHLAEHATYSRIAAAEAARKFPIILEMLADGSVNLTTIRLLAPHLTPQNHIELLLAAMRKSTHEVKQLVANIRPLPSVPPSIRKLPVPRKDTAQAAPDPQRPMSAGSVAPHITQAPSDGPGGEILQLQAPGSSESPRHRALISPLGLDRYRVQFTANAHLRAKIQRAQDLLRHQIPDGNLEEVMDRALTTLLEQLERRKTAATDRPVSRVKEPKQDSRHIPADVRRKVWKRDGGRCAFIGKNGRRCDQRGFLEFHHVVPYSVGGQATVENIQLRCRAHNGYEADQYFGDQGFGFVRETYRNSFQNEFVKVPQFPVEPQGTNLKHYLHEYPPPT